MAGFGERFGNPLPKQFQNLAGKKVYLWTLDAFLSSQLFEEIILVVPNEYISLVCEEIPSAVRVIGGGHTRQESSYRGLIACGSQTEIAVIHDGVRPFVSQKILEENIAGAREHRAVDTCIPSNDTIVHAPGKQKIYNIPKRSDYFRGQTPQSFSYSLIMEAHEKTKIKHATDDCQLVLEMNKDVYLVEGSDENLKITTPLDLRLAEIMIRKNLQSALKIFS